MRKPQTALLSVYDKTGIVDAARELAALGVRIIASSGTARELHAAGIEATAVQDLVAGSGLKRVKDVLKRLGLLEGLEVKIPAEEFQAAVGDLGQPILDHRVVTLVPQIHAGLLARPELPQHLKDLEDLGVPVIDIVFCDLYPLQAAIAEPEATLESVLEKTDIGGPAMIRAAAKGLRLVAVEPADRGRIIEALKSGAEDLDILAQELGAKAEMVAADYALAAARYRSEEEYDGLIGKKILQCKYGENGWQTPAALYSVSSGPQEEDLLALDKFVLAGGTVPSYNNLCDLDRLLQTMTHIAAAFKKNRGDVPHIAVAVKHGNACGAAVDENRGDALKKMIAGGTRAIFGGLVMTNFAIGEEEAEVLSTHLMPVDKDGKPGRRLLDGVVAASFSPEAIEMLRRGGDKCRFLVNPELADLNEASLDTAPRFRYVRGGFLKQPNYTFVPDLEAAEKTFQAAANQENDMLLAWAVGSTSNSNTITLVKDGQLLGNGVGQQDRVGGAELAIKRAYDEGHDIDGASAYSDSFFPFPDGPEALLDAGVTAILSTSGSKNDGLTRQLCVDREAVLYLLPDSEARGFFGH